MAVVSGGTTLIDNGALDAGVPTGDLILLSTQTASASASLEFSMDSSYDSYIFKFYDIHPSNDRGSLEFNMSTDNGSNYNVAKTTTVNQVAHDEADTSASLQYRTDIDNAQGTGFQSIAKEIGNTNDECCAGVLQIFNPSSNTFVKHFISNINVYFADSYSLQHLTAGYGNTTSPVTNLKFQMSSGNIDDGIIKMYGVA